MFLTPYIIRNKTELRALALDERQKFINSLGRKEIHEMPASQIREVYKPSFSIPVSPEADLNATYGVAPGPENPSTYETAPSSGTNVETPFNTEEIGPTSMYKPGGAKSGPIAPSAVTVPSAPSSPGAVSSPTAAIAPSTPFDAGAGAVSPGAPAVAAGGLSESSSALGTSSNGVTPALDP